MSKNSLLNKKNFSWIKKNKFYLAGAFFVLLQIFILYKYLFLIKTSNLLWFCGHTPIIFALGFFTKNQNIIKTLICVGLIPQLFWVVDFLGKIFFGIFIFGASDYMFMNLSVFSYSVSVIEHFLSAGLALILTYKYKPKKKILLFSFIYLLIILILSLSLTTEDYNYNLTRHIILGDEFSFSGYSYAWLFLAMIILVIPTYYFQLFLYNMHNKNKKEKNKR